VPEKGRADAPSPILVARHATAAPTPGPSPSTRYDQSVPLSVGNVTHRRGREDFQADFGEHVPAAKFG